MNMPMAPRRASWLDSALSVLFGGVFDSLDPHQPNCISEGIL